MMFEGSERQTTGLPLTIASDFGGFEPEGGSGKENMSRNTGEALQRAARIV